MRKRYFLPLAAALLLASCNNKPGDAQNNDHSHDSMPLIPVTYPQTAESAIEEDFFGTKVKDPFRWLEVEDSAATKEWVAAQNKVTFGWLEKVPFRNKIKERLEKVWNYPKYGAPFREGSHYFFYKNDGLQNQSVLHIQDGIDGEPRVFLDPNKFSADGTASLSTFSVSRDGKFAVYGVSEGGSDWNEFFVMDVDKAEKVADHLKWIKFSGAAWQGDGFYYSRFAEPKAGKQLSSENENQQVYFHKLGTDQSKDQLIYEDKAHPLLGVYAGTTEDERFLLLYLSEGATNDNALKVKDLTKPGSKFVDIATTFDHSYNVIDNVGDQLLVMTNEGATRSRVVKIDVNKPGKENWVEIIPERAEVLNSVSHVGGKLFASYLKDASSMIAIHDQSGKQLGEVALPGIGTASDIIGRPDDNTAFYTFTSFIYPTTIFKYDAGSNKSEQYRKSEVDFDPSGYETKQVFYNSKDGTKVPMFIVHKKGITLDGNNPTLLYGYGGFNVNILPAFSTSNIVLLENGGVYAVANLRGGGEYGEDWHKAGMLLKKQNVFDDFIAAAEYLIANKYTSSEKLGIMGRSNGGLLVGAVMCQRPDLFKVAFPGVGVMDMLRYHKFTIGHAWAVEYGRSDQQEHFANLYGYSPLHNLKDGTAYPATLVTTADHDDRVVPAHSYKFISRLQQAHKGKLPVLIRIDTMAGHGAGKPTSKIIEEAADIWSFLFYNTNSPVKY
ncbi:MAG: prolyl oligopeptidase family serine peptidase [Bacteroidia bacterium]